MCTGSLSDRTLRTDQFLGIQLRKMADGVFGGLLSITAGALAGCGTIWLSRAGNVSGRASEEGSEAAFCERGGGGVVSSFSRSVSEAKSSCIDAQPAVSRQLFLAFTPHATTTLFTE